MITEYIRENELLTGSTQRVNFNIPAKLLNLSDLLRIRINPKMTRTEFIHIILLQFVVENRQEVDEIFEDNKITMEALEWMKR